MQQQNLFEAISAGDESAVRTLLESDPALAASRNDAGVSALLTALYQRQAVIADVIRPLVELDVFEAAALGDERALQQHLDTRCDLTATSADGFTVLHLACYFGRVEASQCLLDASADVNAMASNDSGLRPIHAAAAAGSTQIMTMLLAAGADPDARQRGGWTALHAAAMHGDRDMTQVLLTAGATADLPADDGKTARDLALEHSHESVARLLGPQR